MNLDRMADLYIYQLGQEPDDSSAWQASRNLLQYLTEAGVSQSEAFETIASSLRLPSPDQLPKTLWKDSLLQPGKIYWHKRLRLQAMPETRKLDGTWDRPQWFLEMKIRFTLSDLLDYGYAAFGTPPVFRNEKRDLGIVRHLLERFSNWEFCEPVDAVLAVIDKAASNETHKPNLYSLQDFEEPAYLELQSKIAQAKLLGLGKIIWRSAK